jgi:hypothetical protein
MLALVIVAALWSGMGLARFAAVLAFLGHIAIVLIMAVFVMALGAFGAGFSILQGSGKFDPIAFVVILSVTLAVLIVYAFAIRSALTFPGRARRAI